MHTAEKLQAAANLSNFKNWLVIGTKKANQNQTYWLRLKILALIEIIGENPIRPVRIYNVKKREE